MQPTSSYSTPSLAGTSSSQQTEWNNSFVGALSDWIEEGSYSERSEREQFADALNEAFSEKAHYFSFSGDITSLPSCIGSVLSLEILELACCRNLTELPSEIGSLNSLETLILSDCLSLQSLPPEISNLHALQEINLSGCLSLRSLPPEIGNLQALQEINLTHCFSLNALPAEIGNLQKLEKLLLASCTSLNSLPPEIGNLCSLNCLDLTLCTHLTSLPPEISNLSSIGLIRLTSCISLACLPIEIGRFYGKPRSLEGLDPQKINLMPVEIISLIDLYPFEYKEFVDSVENFIKLLQESYYCREVKVEFKFFSEGSTFATHAIGPCIQDFKNRLIEKRLQRMEKECVEVTRTIGCLLDGEFIQEFLDDDGRAPALPLIVLDCFLAEDARVHCLRVAEEVGNRL